MYKLLCSSEGLQRADTHPTLKLLLNYHKVKNSETSTSLKELKPGDILGMLKTKQKILTGK